MWINECNIYAVAATGLFYRNLFRCHNFLSPGFSPAFSSWGCRHFWSNLRTCHRLKNGRDGRIQSAAFKGLGVATAADLMAGNLTCWWENNLERCFDWNVDSILGLDRKSVLRQTDRDTISLMFSHFWELGCFAFGININMRDARRCWVRIKKLVHFWSPRERGVRRTGSIHLRGRVLGVLKILVYRSLSLTRFRMFTYNIIQYITISEIKHDKTLPANMIGDGSI